MQPTDQAMPPLPMALRGNAHGDCPLYIGAQMVAYARAYAVTQCEAATARIAELEKDASRYRHIKPMFRTFSLDMSGQHSYCPAGELARMRGPSLDAAIDAAIAKEHL